VIVELFFAGWSAARQQCEACFIRGGAEFEGYAPPFRLIEIDGEAAYRPRRAASPSMAISRRSCSPWWNSNPPISRAHRWVHPAHDADGARHHAAHPAPLASFQLRGACL